MAEKITSTVAFKSNLQIVAKQSISDDRRFLSYVRDPFGLEIMHKKKMYMTPVQQREFEKASLHCVYAFEDDYPFGTIVDSDGCERVVCKCINTECGLFKQCRPDFDSAELNVVEQNVLFQDAVAGIDTLVDQLKKTKQESLLGNELAASLLYSDREEHGEKTDSGIAEQAAVEIDTVEQASEELFNSSCEENEEIPAQVIKDATFESFDVINQTDIIHLDPEERTVVNAGPGTGKTWTLIEKIKYMLNELGTDPENILVLCFSKAAVEVIRTRLEAAARKDELPINWHQVDVRSFDSFATYMLAWLLENKPELLPDNYILEVQSYNERIYRATEVLKQASGILDSYEHVIVDEVQDLVGVRAEMVLALLKILPASCGFTLLGDSCQALYDYLSENDSQIMSSENFYKTLFHEFPLANYYSMEKNFRQGDNLGKTTLPYREAILTGTPESRSQEAALLDSVILTSDADLVHFTANDEKKYTKAGTLGILTRTNGQALQISSWLRTEGIHHNLQSPINSSELGAWIACVFLEAETDVIDFSEFQKIFERLYPRADAGKFWDATLSTQIDQTKRHYEIEDLLRGLIKNARNPLLFDEPCNESALITVSNVHRSKGREYDTVLVLEDIIKDMSSDELEDQLEHKVCYVALTRPKNKIEKVKLKSQYKYIYISKDEERRCFRAGGFGNRKYLSHYEVGFDTDFDSQSFAGSEYLQNYLRESVRKDTRLKLLKCPENTKRYVAYKIVPEECPDVVLGYTTGKFAYSMEKAIQRIFSNPRPVDYKYFPKTFGDLYVDGLTSCVSARGENLPGAVKFGSMYIWNGIRVSGFAQMEKDRY